VPVVAVLGNHDYQSDDEDRVRKVLENAGLTVLEGETWTAEVRGPHDRRRGGEGFGSASPAVPAATSGSRR
jgi:predicted MPP superfamily phosphohydrolase